MSFLSQSCGNGNIYFAVSYAVATLCRGYENAVPVPNVIALISLPKYITC